MIRHAVFVAALLTATAMGLKASTPATEVPDLSFSDESGRTLRLADFKGQVVLLDFWASWCVPCRVSFPALDALHKELGARGFSAVAINVDEQRKNADSFLEVRPHTMPVVFDPKGRAAEAFALPAMPSALILDRAGRVRFRHTGYTEKTITQYRSEILQLLKEDTK
jgi:thiol-disulfide isomerase/thioredoxin